jgi:hypothetical protein
MYRYEVNALVNTTLHSPYSIPYIRLSISLSFTFQNLYFSLTSHYWATIARQSTITSWRDWLATSLCYQDKPNIHDKATANVLREQNRHGPLNPIEHTMQIPTSIAAPISPTSCHQYKRFYNPWREKRCWHTAHTYDECRYTTTNNLRSRYNYDYASTDRSTGRTQDYIRISSFTTWTTSHNVRYTNNKRAYQWHHLTIYIINQPTTIVATGQYASAFKVITAPSNSPFPLPPVSTTNSLYLSAPAVAVSHRVVLLWCSCLPLYPRACSTTEERATGAESEDRELWESGWWTP